MRHSFTLSELAFHGLEEDVFERIAAVVHAANLNRAFCRKRIQLTHFELLGHDQLETAIAEARAFTSQLACGFEEAVIIFEFKFYELEVGFALLFEVTKCGNASVFEDDDLFAALFNVAQEMGRNHNMDFSGITNLFDELDHALPRCWIQ